MYLITPFRNRSSVFVALRSDELDIIIIWLKGGH